MDRTVVNEVVTTIEAVVEEEAIATEIAIEEIHIAVVGPGYAMVSLLLFTSAVMHIPNLTPNCTF